MKETKITEGIFGINDDINTYIHGSLTVNEHGDVRLTLSDSFETDITGAYKELKVLTQRPLIKGYGNNGKYYELINCVSLGGSFPLGGITIPTVIYRCDFLFEYPNESYKSKKFFKICFEIDKLNVWANDDECSNYKMSGNHTVIDISHKNHWEKEKDGFKYSIYSGYKCLSQEANINLYLDFVYSFNIEYEPNFIKLDFVQDLINKAFDFTNLLLLFISESAHINAITIISEDKLDYVKVYCHNTNVEREKEIETYRELSMTGLKDVANNLIDIFEKYQALKEKLNGTIYSIKGAEKARKYKHVDVAEYVKNTATAIEGFMLNMGLVDFEDDPKDYQAKISRIMEHQTKEDAKWLREKLKFANAASFRKQVNNLFEEMDNKFSEQINGFFDGKKQRKDLINRFVNTRNFYVHYDIDNKKEMLGESTQIYFCDFINEMLRLFVLLEIGVELSVIHKNNINNQSIKFCKDNLLKYYREENNKRSING